jgi:hypothetical protein
MTYILQCIFWERLQQFFPVTLLKGKEPRQGLGTVPKLKEVSVRDKAFDVVPPGNTIQSVALVGGVIHSSNPHNTLMEKLNYLCWLCVDEMIYLVNFLVARTAGCTIGQ